MSLSKPEAQQVKIQVIHAHTAGLATKVNAVLATTRLILQFENTLDHQLNLLFNEQP